RRSRSPRCANQSLAVMDGAVFQKFLSLMSTISTATGLFPLAAESIPTLRSSGLGRKVTLSTTLSTAFLVLSTTFLVWLHAAKLRTRPDVRKNTIQPRLGQTRLY